MFVQNPPSPVSPQVSLVDTRPMPPTLCRADAARYRTDWVAQYEADRAAGRRAYQASLDADRFHRGELPLFQEPT